MIYPCMTLQRWISDFALKSCKIFKISLANLCSIYFIEGNHLFMMVNFGSLVQIGIRDIHSNYARKKERKKIFFFSMGSNERKKKKRKYFFFFLSFSHNLSELSLIPIWTREPKCIIMSNKISKDFYVRSWAGSLCQKI